jgi:formylglycine-generating enzyme required for sulfatase activity
VVTRNLIANGYRLPLEKEWEWAARGGVSSKGYTYSGSNDVSAVAWYSGNSNSAEVDLTYWKDGNGTWPVGQKKPNELGVHDMTGNVYEWCYELEDYEGVARRYRGGSWDSDDRYAMIAHRDDNHFDPTFGFDYPVNKDPAVGFRLARNAGN